MKGKIAGLNLWQIAIRCDYSGGRAGATLLITTAKHSIEQATEKARRFLMRHQDTYPAAKIHSVTRQGELDA